MKCLDNGDYITLALDIAEQEFDQRSQVTSTQNMGWALKTTKKESNIQKIGSKF